MTFQRFSATDWVAVVLAGAVVIIFASAAGALIATLVWLTAKLLGTCR